MSEPTLIESESPMLVLPRAEAVILRSRRQMSLGALVQILLLLTGIAAIIVGTFLGQAFYGSVLTVGLAVLWVTLAQKSLRAQQHAAGVEWLISEGKLDLAEVELAEASQRFSLFRLPKLLALHQMGVLRHVQGRFRDSALLAREVQSHHLDKRPGIAVASHVMLAEAALEMGDLPSAYASIAWLSARPLGLPESQRLLALEVDYGSRISAWPIMMSTLPQRWPLIELLPTAPAALTQALLALAAKNNNHPDLSTWLWKRATLLEPAPSLLRKRPMLSELAPDQTP